MKLLKNLLKRTWLGKAIKKVLRKKTKKRDFPGSKNYWENRYLSKKDSGPGSYGRLADFKAEILNSFVENNKIKTVIEYGCGDGNQLSLANYPNYIGFEVSNRALEICRDKFKMDDSKVFYNVFDDTYKNSEADLVLSLDVLFHLIEDEVFNVYMKRLFSSSTKYVIIYSSNYDDHFVAHVKCRKFTNWIDNNVTENWILIEKIKNRYPLDSKNPHHTSMADFYMYERNN